MGVVDDDAGEGGAECGGGGKHHGDHAHSRAAPVGREDIEDAVKQQRHEEGGGYSLHHAPDQQHAEVGRQSTNQRTGEEGGLGDEQHFAGFKPLDNAGGNRRECAHHQEKAGGEPLGSGFVDVEIAHDGRERHVEQGIVQVAEEGADKERGHDGFGGEAGAVGEVFVLGVGRIGVLHRAFFLVIRLWPRGYLKA